MVMAGVAIVAIAAIDDHYRGAGPISRIVELRISAVVRRIVAVVAVAVVAVAVAVVRGGRRCPDKSAREEASGHWQKPRLSRSRFGSCRRTTIRKIGS